MINKKWGNMKLDVGLDVGNGKYDERSFLISNLLTNFSFLFTALLFIFLFGFAANAAIVGSTDDVSVVGGGARPLGMGRAFTAVGDDADAAFINPAGVAAIKAPQAMAMFTNLFGEAYYSEFCGVIPAPFGNVGLGYVMTGVTQIPTDFNGNTVFTDYHDNMLILTYSSPMSRFLAYGDNIFIGLNYKLFDRGFSGGVNQTAFGVSADVGVKFILNQNISFGINRQNILPVALGSVLHYSSGAEETISTLTKVGVAIRPKPLKNALLLAFDADLPASSTRPLTMHAGAEWRVTKNLFLRCGLDQSVDTATASYTSWNPAYGMSFSYAGFRVDYAYHPYYNDPTLATGYVSLSYTGEPSLIFKSRTE